MDWKKIAESDELIVFEKQLKDQKLKIEARKADNTWEIFKTQIKGDSSNLISVHSIDNKTKAKKLIERLKREKKSRPKYSSLKISLKRAHKEDFVEKWYFNIENEKMRNFLYIKFDDEAQVDIVMHESFRFYEKSIIKQVEDKLGLNDLADTINYNIYYFSKHRGIKNANQHIYNYLDIEFDFTE